MKALALLDGEEVARRLSVVDAADALEAALRAGLDPEADRPEGGSRSEAETCS